MISVRADLVAAMGGHAAAGYPEECCGGLIGRSDGGERTIVERIEPVVNARDDERRRRYLIGPEDVAELERQAAEAGLELVGFYHSHPDHPAKPSEFDREHAWPWYAYVIIPVESGVAGAPRAWRLSDDRARFSEVDIRIEEESK